MNGLSGKSVIVTGGASGIGLATVSLLVKEGCKVVIADVNAEAAGSAVAALKGAGSYDPISVIADVSNESDVKHMIKVCIETFGRLDGAVNGAAVMSQGKTVDILDVEEWDRCYAINARGVFLCVKHQIRAMLETGGGSIAAISSLAAIYGVPVSPEYCSSKAAVAGLVRNVAIDFAKSGIRINAVLPGATWTPMVAEQVSRDPAFEEFSKRLPLGRYAEPDEIANGIAWLISDQSSYVTGTNFTIDGALSINCA